MKKLFLFAIFALLCVGFLAALGEAEGKSPPGVEIGYYDLQPLAPVVSVEVEKPVVIVLVEVDSPTLNGVKIYEVDIYAIHKTEAETVRRHDRRFWSIYVKEVKSLYAYGHLLYEAAGSIESALSTICKGAFKTEYG